MTIVLTSALGYAYWLAAAHLFPAHQIGLANGLVSLMTITAIVANLGTAPALVQRLPRAARRRGVVDDAQREPDRRRARGRGSPARLVLLALPLLSPRLAAARGEPLLGALFVARHERLHLQHGARLRVHRRAAQPRDVGRGAVFALVKIPLVAAPALAFGTVHGTVVIFASWVLAYAISCLRRVSRCCCRGCAPASACASRGTLRELRRSARLLAGNYLITLGNALPLYLLPVIVVTRLSATANAYFYITWMVGGIFFMISSAIGSSLFAEGSERPRAPRCVRRARASA